jgi:hypothetical protein
MEWYTLGGSLQPVPKEGGKTSHWVLLNSAGAWGSSSGQIAFSSSSDNGRLVSLIPLNRKCEISPALSRSVKTANTFLRECEVGTPGRVALKTSARIALSTPFTSIVLIMALSVNNLLGSLVGRNRFLRRCPTRASSKRDLGSVSKSSFSSNASLFRIASEVDLALTMIWLLPLEDWD